MERSPHPTPLPGAGIAHRLLCWTLLAGLVVGHGWLALQPFGGADGWERLLDDSPVLSGRHPLHLYHGYLGARALLARGTPCCYDADFQAGYPKTPVFDGGSRPAELFLALAGGAYQPAAYKIGLVVCCALVPLLLALAARGAGLGWGGTVLAVGLGLAVWWSPTAQRSFVAGDLDLLLAALSAALHVGLLLRYHRLPGALSWLGVGGSLALTLFAQPAIAALLVPPLLIFYLSVGTRHALPWHLGLFTALAAALGGNAFWVRDWVGYWWLRAPAAAAASSFPTDWGGLWEAPLWGGAVERLTAVGLLGSAVLGGLLLNRQGHRAAARVFGLGAGGFLALAFAADHDGPLSRLGVRNLLVPSLLFAAPLAAHTGQQFFRLLGAACGGRGRAAVVGLGALLAAVGLGHETLSATLPLSRPEPLAIGLGPQRTSLVELLREKTTNDARILWEDRADAGAEGRWTALLPVLTGRSFLGGLDTEDAIDHGHACCRGRSLAGQDLAERSDDDLERFCRRYNIGWVVAFSPEAVARFRAWPLAEPTAEVADGGPGVLFALRRERSYALRGSARWLRATAEHVTLADVVPENGEVLLSLHYQKGLRATPARVQVEREADPCDPVPFVRLQLAAPVARLTLTWEK